MPMMPSKPLWYMTTGELRKWKKQVFLLPGFLAQVVILDQNEPIGIMMGQPKLLDKKEGITTGVFLINEYEIIAGKKLKPKIHVPPRHVVTTYDAKAKVFSWRMPWEALEFVLAHPDITPVDGEERKRLSDAMRLSA